MPRGDWFGLVTALARDTARLIAATGRRTQTTNVPALAAAIAYHALLSLAPFLLLVLTAVASVLGSEEAQARLVGAIESLGDPSVVAPLRTTLELVVKSRGSVLANAAGILVMVYFASAVLNELAEALNRIWDVPPRAGISGLLVQRLVAVVLVPAAIAAGIVLMGLSFVVALLAPIVTGLMPVDTPVWAIGRTLVPFLLMTVLLALLYRHAPRTAVAWSDVRIGAALTAFAFTAGNAILASTLRNNVVASLYGAAGALVLVLLWIFYSANILLIGACFTREYADLFGSRSKRPVRA